MRNARHIWFRYEKKTSSPVETRSYFDGHGQPLTTRLCVTVSKVAGKQSGLYRVFNGRVQFLRER